MPLINLQLKAFFYLSPHQDAEPYLKSFKNADVLIELSKQKYKSIVKQRNSKQREKEKK